MATTSKLYNILSASIAFVMWGLWAYFVNVGKGASSPYLYAIVQGVFSFVMTLVIVRVLQYFWVRMQGQPFADLAPVIFTVFLTGLVLVLIHVLIATPNLIGTVIAPLTVSFAFCLFTVKKLKKSKENDGRK
jgi:hypothetical protein